MLIPLGISVSTISFYDYVDKKITFTSIINDASLLTLEAKFVNEGLIPFWLFNLRY